MSRGWTIATVLIGVLVLLALAVTSTFFSRRNEMVRQKEAIQGSWSQVDVVLQRRADLIPNLVETVKGYAAH